MAAAVEACWSGCSCRGKGVAGCGCRGMLCLRRNTGAEERAGFSASKLAWVSAVHVNRAVGLPSAVSGAATSA